MALFWCLYFQLQKYFTPCSSVSIVNFELVHSGGVVCFSSFIVNA